MGELRGRRALVTGGSSGLGRHFAQVLAGQGAAVTVAARRLPALQQTCALVAAAGGLAEPLVLDVTDPAAVAAALSDPFDIVVANAGVAHDAPALQTAPADWDRVIATDLSGVFHVAQAAARAMVAAGRGGAIVTIASIVGLRVAGNLSAYAAAKAGVIHLTRALALEWARHGIRVNALCPGYIETDLNRAFFATEAGQALIRRIPQRRIGQPADLDGALMLLCSDAGRYITGAEIAVDGGHLVGSL